MEAAHYIQQDWETREFLETLTAGIKRIVEFLNTFGTARSCRHVQQLIIPILAYIDTYTYG